MHHLQLKTLCGVIIVCCVFFCLLLDSLSLSIYFNRFDALKIAFKNMHFVVHFINFNEEHC